MTRPWKAALICGRQDLWCEFMNLFRNISTLIHRNIAEFLFLLHFVGHFIFPHCGFFPLLVIILISSSFFWFLVLM